MSTRSCIAVRLPTGTYRAIYCQSDGYYSWNGVRLMDSWHDVRRAAILTNQGDLSSLGRHIGKGHDFEWSSKFVARYRHDNPDADYGEAYAARDADERNEWCRFYERDRNEKNGRIFGNYNTRAALIEAFMGSMCEYLYLFSYETWWTLDRDSEAVRWIPLAHALAEDDDPDCQGVKAGPSPYLPKRSHRLALEDMLFGDVPPEETQVTTGRRPMRV